MDRGLIVDDDAIVTFEEHEQGLCGGTWAACSYHDAEDLIRARAIKAEMQRMAVRKPDYSSVATESAE